MNEVQAKIAELQQKGWTVAALADELGVTVNAVEKWKAGDRYPQNAKAVLIVLGQLTKRKRIPKKWRYIKDKTMGSNQSDEKA
ncbi:helix-turn-helix domain-containing protein [Chloroflexota bacterium]